MPCDRHQEQPCRTRVALPIGGRAAGGTRLGRRRRRHPPRPGRVGRRGNGDRGSGNPGGGGSPGRRDPAGGGSSRGRDPGSGGSPGCGSPGRRGSGGPGSTTAAADLGGRRAAVQLPAPPVERDGRLRSPQGQQPAPVPERRRHRQHQVHGEHGHRLRGLARRPEPRPEHPVQDPRRGRAVRDVRHLQRVGGTIPSAERPGQPVRSVLRAPLGGLRRRRPGRLSVHSSRGARTAPRTGASSTGSSCRRAPSTAIRRPESRRSSGPAGCR